MGKNPVVAALRNNFVRPQARPGRRAGSSQARLNVASSQAVATAGQLSFREAFGARGEPMLLIVRVGITWTSWLILLTAAPAWTAFHLMSTRKVGEGGFWLIRTWGSKRSTWRFRRRR